MHSNRRVITALNQLSHTQLRRLANEFDRPIERTRGLQVLSFLEPVVQSGAGKTAREQREDMERRIACAQQQMGKQESMHAERVVAEQYKACRQVADDQYDEARAMLGLSESFDDALFIDPIGFEPIHPDKLIVVEGHCFDKDTLKAWASRKVTDPRTGAVIEWAPTNPMTGEALTQETIALLSQGSPAERLLEFLHDNGYGRLKSDRMRYMTDLDIRNTRAVVPVDIGMLRALQRLKLSGTNVYVALNAIMTLNKLQELHLDDTRLIRLPDSLGDLRDLRVLYIQDNRLTELPQSIGNLHALEMLNARNNRLESLPKSFVGLVSLEGLDLRNNRLDAFPLEITELPKLEFANLRGNRFGGVPKWLRTSIDIDV